MGSSPPSQAASVTLPSSDGTRHAHHTARSVERRKCVSEKGERETRRRVRWIARTVSSRTMYIVHDTEPTRTAVNNALTTSSATSGRTAPNT
jgi:hypothetical protein